MPSVLTGGAAVFALAALLPPAPPAGAAPPQTTYAELQRIMQQSKRAYRVVPTDAPIAKPATEISCLARIPLLRVVTDARGDRQLEIWMANGAAAPHFEAAEKLFSAQQLDEAEREYRRGLELDPDYGPGWLFSGDIPFGRGNYPVALASYRKAIALDPTLPQAHRFAGDALAHLGKLGDAEDEYVTALSWDPSYRGAFEGLVVLGAKAGYRASLPEFQPPRDAFGESRDGKVLIRANPEWQAYLSCRAVWRYEPGYRLRRLGREVADAAMSLSIEEESECLAMYVTANYAAAEQRLLKAAKEQGREGATFDADAVYAAGPPAMRQVAQAVRDGVLQGMVSFLMALRCPPFAAMQPPAGHAEIERYIRTEVVVRPAAQPPK